MPIKRDVWKNRDEKTIKSFFCILEAFLISKTLFLFAFMDCVLFQNYLCACRTFGRVQNELGTTIWRNNDTGPFFFIHWQVNETLSQLQWMKNTASFKEEFWIQSQRGLQQRKSLMPFSLPRFKKNVLHFLPITYYIIWKFSEIYKYSNQGIKIIL